MKISDSKMSESKAADPKMNSSKVIVALDYSSSTNANLFVDSISPELCKLKVGKELFTLAGPDFVSSLVGKGFDVFLDLKFHDIPNTVSSAVKVAADMGVWMFFYVSEVCFRFKRYIPISQRGSGTSKSANQ